MKRVMPDPDPEMSEIPCPTTPEDTGACKEEAEDNHGWGVEDVQWLSSAEQEDYDGKTWHTAEDDGWNVARHMNGGRGYGYGGAAYDDVDEEKYGGQEWKQEGGHDGYGQWSQHNAQKWKGKWEYPQQAKVKGEYVPGGWKDENGVFYKFLSMMISLACFFH